MGRMKKQENCIDVLELLLITFEKYLITGGYI
jgi:hypothetical protein